MSNKLRFVGVVFVPFWPYWAGYLWGLNQVRKHFGYLLMYINNFPLDIIAVQMQNQTRMGGLVGGWWLAG